MPGTDRCRVRRSDRAVALLLLLALTVPACGRRSSPPVALAVGEHRVRLATPRGWEHLDHGRAQLFRNGETELRLEDLGAATPHALAAEIRAARETWLTGRRRDAVARMRTLDGPVLAFLAWQRRADFWRPWSDVAYVPDPVDSAALGGAFDAMIDGAEALPEVSPDHLVEWVLERDDQAALREIARLDSLTIHDARWTSIETWSRLTHGDRHRTAFVLDGGDLLALSIERGLPESTLGAFDSLLATIEVLPRR